MKIVYFNYLYDTTEASVGAAVHVKELAAALHEQGHELQVYHLNFWHAEAPSGVPSAWQRIRGFLKTRLRRYVAQLNQFLSNARYAIKERAILRRERPEVLLIRYNLLHFSAVLLAKGMGIPVVLEVNSPMAFERKHLVRDLVTLPLLPQWIETLNLRLADHVFVVSKVLKEYFVRRGIAAGKITVVVNGVDVQRFSPEVSAQRVRARHGLQGKIVAGFVGSFHHWHGMENILLLIKRTWREHPNLAFLLVGDGPLKRQTDAFVREHHLEQVVVRPGYVPHHEIPEYVAAMDVVLAPYPKIDFFYFSPLKIFEYMAAGKAVVASRLGQIAELIRDGENGELYAPERTEELISKTVALVDDAARRRRIGSAARQTIVDGYTWQHNARTISTILSSVLPGNRRVKSVELMRAGSMNPNQIEV